MEFPTLPDGTITGIVDEVKAKIENPLVALTGGVILGAGITAGVTALAHKKKSYNKKQKKKSSKKSRHSHKKLKFGSKAYRKKHLGKHRGQKQPHTAGKGKDTSHRRIRFTKHNQPYIILPNGRAKFIKKSSVGRRRKLKGGSY